MIGFKRTYGGVMFFSKKKREKIFISNIGGRLQKLCCKLSLFNSLFYDLNTFKNRESAISF